MHAGTLAHELDRLANTGRVLYIAAHPDDENTRLLAYLANARHLDTAYLAMTRGGGGQNLIGAEKAELLDVIRTEELLAARRTDAASQRFTRMRDFGYSKTATETLAVWGHEQALADVVWVIRSFRPDVLIARFSEQPPNHGHHTASATLAREAFAAAADPARFPEQLERGVEPWQALRLLRNVSHWREDPPPPDSVPIEVGGYDARLGVSYGELAALSRSQHKSQGFGAAGQRGSIVERFVLVAGAGLESDILDGVDSSWARFGAPGKAFGDALDRARADLNRDRPENAIPALLAARAAAAALPDVARVRDARHALDRVIAAAAGLFVRAAAARPEVTPNGSLPVTLEVVVGRADAVDVRRVTVPDRHQTAPGKIERGERREISHEVEVRDAPITVPYWLAQPSQAGRQTVTDPRLVGAPKGPAALEVEVEIEIGGQAIRLATPVVYAWTDRVHGERIRDVQVVPPATVTPLRDAVLFPGGRPSIVALRVRSASAPLDGEVSLNLPPGWQSQPPAQTLHFDEATREQVVQFTVTPAKDAGAVAVEPIVRVGDESWSYRDDTIDYPHIPVQQVLRPVSVRLVPLDLELPQGTIGYVPGSGDTVADDLRSVGARVDIVDDETLRAGDLGSFAAILVGIRAYNTNPVLHSAHPRLMDYVENGGTVVVQYNTHSRWSPLDTAIGPYPLELGRGRVTDETAAVQLLAPVDPALHRPNRITDADFDGWVQERGLYFGETWDDHYQPLLAIADAGEDPLRGSLLIARHGRGRYVYTGLSFFRQLPAGVPGGYRLLANLLARDGDG